MGFLFLIAEKESKIGFPLLFPKNSGREDFSGEPTPSLFGGGERQREGIGMTIKGELIAIFLYYNYNLYNYFDIRILNNAKVHDGR